MKKLFMRRRFARFTLISLIAIFLFIISTSTASATEITTDPVDVSGEVGDTIDITVNMRLTHTPCQKTLSDIKFEPLAGVEIDSQTDWVQLSSTRYRKTVTVDLTAEGSTGLHIYRICSKGGEDMTVPIEIAAATGNGDELTAAFSSSLTSTKVGQNITFSDSCTGTPTSWAWDFDNDGTVDSIDQNPVYAYDTAGTYSVKLTVADAGGDSDEMVKTDYIVVSSGGGGCGASAAATTADMVSGASIVGMLGLTGTYLHLRKRRK